DSGSILIRGNPVSLNSPVSAQAQGISIIYQEFNLIPHLTVRENIFLGREIRKGPFIDEGAEAKKAKELFKQLGLDINPEKRCGVLTIAEQQLVEIAKALSLDARILIMDEPSATLTHQEVERLFKIVRQLKQQGIGILYISHRLEEIFSIADRVMVLRDGRHVVTAPVPEVNRKKLIEWMVGRPLESEFPKRSANLGETVLEVKNLCRGNEVQHVSFHVRAGEILGFAGLVGAGRTAAMRLVFGADRKDAGEIILHGKPVVIRKPREAIAQGICLLTEDRKSQGLVLKHSVKENFGLPNLKQYAKGPFIDEKKEQERFEKYAADIKIKISNPDQDAGHLSGGNQQKIVLAKWLERNADVLIFDEPTRGIDVGAKYEIYQLMNRLAEKGKAIIMVSSELPEVMGMSDRILVMRGSRIQGEITDVEHCTQEEVMHLAVE
ncbi:MAG: sugar ABC transporter ATP-binding protein, partial [Verrucomicrobiae bacterium]|nr:sugar ABC transporter ATP-binding protein [Verrucomicrobiae bacterium]